MTDKNVNPDDNQADDNQAGENVEERFADIVDGVDIDDDQPTADSQAPEEMSREAQLEALLAERTEDLQRLQAEYVNYKRRVDRDRALSRQSGVDKVITDLMPRLDATRDEIESIMTALDGGFVSPGQSGAPSRGNAHILPTGRNFFSLDPEAMPTPTGWLEGVELADQLLAGYAEAHPDQPWPRTVGVVVWGTANMRSGGADIAEILYLMGVRPIWESSGLVSGLQIIDPVELGRPRIDVSPRI